jgi:hypothetical protein
MKLTLLLSVAILPLINARQNQQRPLSLNSLHIQSVDTHHSQPWSLLLSQNPTTSSCIVLSRPEQAQIHRSIKEPGDVLVINKTLSSVDGFEVVDEYVMEVIGYDQRVLWSTTSQLCSSISYDYPSTLEKYSEFEVVLSLYIQITVDENTLLRQSRK